MSQEGPTIDDLKRIVQSKPNDTDALRNLANAYLGLNLLDEALQVLMQIVQLNPKVIDAYSRIGAIYLLRKDWGNAIKAFKTVIDLDPNHSTAANAYLNLGAVYAELKEYEKAIETIKNAIRIDPNEPAAYYNLGLCYVALERHKEAIKALKQSVHLDPKVAQSYHLLVIEYLAVGDEESAREAYIILKKLSPNLAKDHSEMENNHNRYKKYERYKISPVNSEKTKLQSVLSSAAKRAGIVVEEHETKSIAEGIKTIFEGRDYCFDQLKLLSKEEDNYPPELVRDFCAYLFAKAVEFVIAWGLSKDGKCRIIYRVEDVAGKSYYSELPKKYHSYVLESPRKGAPLFNAYHEYVSQRINKGEGDNIDFADEVKELFLWCSLYGMNYGIEKGYHELAGDSRGEEG